MGSERASGKRTSEEEEEEEERRRERERDGEGELLQMQRGRSPSLVDDKMDVVEEEVAKLLHVPSHLLEEKKLGRNNPLLLRQKSYIDEAEMEGHAELREKLWNLLCTYLPCDVLSLQKSIVQHVEYTLARRRYKRDKGKNFKTSVFDFRLLTILLLFY